MTYFFVELVVGHMLKSITLTADSFHMLSDFIALSIAIAARRIGKWPKSSKNTFGWQRAEVVGTLINTVILTTLTFTILIKSIQRFIDPETITKPHILFYVGVGGLVINIIGLLILRNSHGHSHGGVENTSLLKDEEAETLEGDVEIHDAQTKPLSVGDVQIVTKEANNVKPQDGHAHNHKHSSNDREKGASHMNMRAVFLHVLADFFGSVAVVVSAAILTWVPESTNNFNWKNKIDPLLGLVMVVIILINTVPLLKKSALILLQSVPKDVSIKELKDRMEKIEGIEKVHDLHVWLLQSDVIIGTVHIRCPKENYVSASKKVKNLFHEFKIHCTTIQAEFNEHAEDSDGRYPQPNACVLYCEGEPDASGSSNVCNAKQSCCPTKATQVPNNNTTTKIPIPSASSITHQESAPCLLMSDIAHEESAPCLLKSDDRSPTNSSTIVPNTRDDDINV